ncbi:MAG: hypothetical protein WHU10_12355, partial [Fimbriimonadales bacterium]
CDWENLPEENTLTKALRLVREIAPVPPLRIGLRKRIPAQAGLGGGSSDAAGLLRAIPSFCKVPVPQGELFEVARAIGADVPFFLVGGRARAEGYGDRLTPLPDAAPAPVLIVQPPCRVSTPQAYRRLDSLPRSLKPWPEGELGPNDFEDVEPEECTGARRALLEAGAQAARLCGSGSAVFGVFASEHQRDLACMEIGRADPQWRVWPAHFLGRAESLAAGREDGDAPSRVFGPKT